MENRAIDMQENWVKWNPFNMPEGEYIVTCFIQNADGVKIILDDDTNIIEIFFGGIPSIVRISDEGIRMRTWGEVYLKYNDKSFFGGWFLFKVKNSKLSEWAEGESCGLYEAEQLTHYCIVTGLELIDILTDFEPTINIRPLSIHYPLD